MKLKPISQLMFDTAMLSGIKVDMSKRDLSKINTISQPQKKENKMDNRYQTHIAEIEESDREANLLESNIENLEESLRALRSKLQMQTDAISLKSDLKGSAESTQLALESLSEEIHEIIEIINCAMPVIDDITESITQSA